MQTPAIIEELILAAAGLPGQREYPLHSWLAHCSPLVLLDLNAVGSDLLREAVACSLASFQCGRSGRDRCVVAYRSTRNDDGAVGVLRRSGAFAFFDLAPLHVEQAVAYLRNVRVFEAEVYGQLGLEPSPRQIDEECARLRELVVRHVRGDESLISTPLLVFLISLLVRPSLSASTATTFAYPSLPCRPRPFPA
jgi:hypothetical protein